MRKSTVDSVTDEACDKLLLDLEVKSCVDPNTLDNVNINIIFTFNLNINGNGLIHRVNALKLMYFIKAHYFYGTCKWEIKSQMPRNHSAH